MTACLRQFGCNSSFGVDHVKARNVAGPVSIADLTTNHGKSLLMQWLSTKNVVGIFLRPPCGTASRARKIKLKRNTRKRKFSQFLEPKPLRTDKFPNGLPHLSWLDKLKVSKANKLYHLTKEVVKFCIKNDIVVCVENPQYSLFWATSFWTEIAHQLKYTVLHACQYGSKRAKKTMLAFSHGAFKALCLKCPGTSTTHVHRPCSSDEDGFTPRQTAQETAYPFALAKCIAHAFVSEFYNHGAVAPAGTLAEVTSTSAQVLQAARSQTGLQPKASRIPPVVSDFKDHVFVGGLPEQLPQLTMGQKLQQPFQLLPGMHPTATILPKSAKLLSIHPGVDAMKGGKACVSTPDMSDLVTGGCVVSQQWAIPWQPMEFVEAVSAGHPLSLKSVVPEPRAEAVKHWLNRSRSLDAEEKSFKQTLNQKVAAVIKDKRVLLWKEMLEHCSYPDMDVVTEFTQGTHLTGDTCASGLWPHKFTPATIAEAELFSLSERERSSVCRNAIVSDDPMVNEAVWQQTMEEVNLGYVAGPYDLEAIPKHYPLSRRFGVKQGEKVRCVDDFTGSSVNQSVQTHESPRPHTLDMVGGMLSLCMAAHSGEDPWRGRVFDLKAAYRQCAVSPSSERFSYISVYDPSSKQVKAFQMLALPFGSVKAVHAFLRVSASLWFIGVKLFRVIWSNYFDDFVTLGQKIEVQSITNSVHCLFRMLGWQYAESGAKAPPFAQSFQALGVTIDVSELHLGKVQLDNTESRKTELTKTIGECLEAGRLPHREALKLRGRMQFTTGQIYGRLSRTCLAVVAGRACAGTGPNLAPRAVSALRLYVDMLLNQGPRELVRSSSHTWFLFTDACFEPESSDVCAGLGGVLIAPNGRPHAFFACNLSNQQIKRLNPNTSKTIIFELEFLAVLCAFALWSTKLYGSQIVAFIDNNGVRDALISCHTTNTIASRILKEIIRFEVASKVLQWYSRVPSSSNIADEPSRQKFDLVKKLGCVQCDVRMDSILHQLDL